MPRLRETATMEYIVQTTVQEWPPQGQWTYDDYAHLPNDGWKYEVMRGELYMSPAPSPRHQVISSNLNFEFQRFVRERDLGKVLVSPIDVILPRGLGTPVQPDILFIRRDNLQIIGETTIDGIPDLAVEILSPSNWVDDRRTKFDVYADAGIAEYWIIDPKKESVEIFTRKGNRYELVEKYDRGDRVASQVLSGFSLAVDEIFAQ